MKEKLIKAVKRKVDKAEVYYYRANINSVQYENGKLSQLEGSIQSGYSLRIIKNRRLGFAYTKNLISPQALINSALESLKANNLTDLDFPATKKVQRIDTYNSAIEKVDCEKVVRECKRITSLIQEEVKAKIDVSAVFGVVEINIFNTNGANLRSRSSFYRLLCNIILPDTAAGFYHSHFDKTFSKVPQKEIQKLISIYKKALPERKLESGRMKVLFLPETLYTFLWRLASGTNGANIYYKKSPLVNKIGEKIFSEKLTIYDDPLNDRYPLARAFDDEGTPTRRLVIVEKGILKNHYYDLYFADKMKNNSTGNGYKGTMWGGEFASLKPNPQLEHIIIEPGTKSLEELIGLMDKGLIVAGVLGAHSGNIPNGDFSVGIAPGLYVEKGNILGRVKNTMIAGNIYEIMKNVVEVENRLHPVFMFGKALPAILFDDLMVVSS